MRILQRWPTIVAVVAAAVIGYQFGALRVAEAGGPKAAKDQSKILLETDRAFDDATARYGVQGWLSYFTEDAMLLPAGSDFVIGREAMRKYLEPRFETPGFTMRWEPIDGYASGDLGYTYGVAKSSRADGSGQAMVTYSKYLTIWRRQADGAWRAALDIGNASPVPVRK